jgi:hypothetical protein
MGIPTGTAFHAAIPIPALPGRYSSKIAELRASCLARILMTAKRSATSMCCGIRARCSGRSPRIPPCGGPWTRSVRPAATRRRGPGEGPRHLALGHPIRHRVHPDHGDPRTRLTLDQLEPNDRRTPGDHAHRRDRRPASMPKPQRPSRSIDRSSLADPAAVTSESSRLGVLLGREIEADDGAGNSNERSKYAR